VEPVPCENIGVVPNPTALRSVPTIPDEPLLACVSPIFIVTPLESTSIFVMVGGVMAGGFMIGVARGGGGGGGGGSPNLQFIVGYVDLGPEFLAGVITVCLLSVV